MDGYRQFDEELERRQRTRLVRVLKAIDDGDTWAMLKAELARDYHALFDHFLTFEKHVDNKFDVHKDR